MKKIYTLFLLYGVCLLLSACSSSTNITIHSIPGTEIFSADKQKLGIVGDDGKLKILTDDASYSAFMFSRAPQSNILVPFALDYNVRDVSLCSTRLGLGYALATVGTAGMAVSAIIMLAGGSDDDEISSGAGKALGYSAGAALVGVGLGLPADNQLEQGAYAHRYKYLSQQTTNHDINIKQPILNDKPSDISHPTAMKVAKGIDVSTSTKSQKHLNQKSKKTFKDFGSQIEGKYVGEGTLTKDKKVIERYKGMSVSIRRISSDKVAVMVEEQDGSKFFFEESQYTVTKSNNEKYLLALDGINSATITIDNTKHLIYIHPKVNIDGDIYELSIKGVKE